MRDTPAGQRRVTHDTTGDGETSPTSSPRPTSRSEPQHGHAPAKIALEAVDVVILKDDSDDGGPIIIRSNDPDLQHLDLPKPEYPGQSVPNDGKAA